MFFFKNCEFFKPSWLMCDSAAIFVLEILKLSVLMYKVIELSKMLCINCNFCVGISNSFLSPQLFVL